MNNTRETEFEIFQNKIITAMRNRFGDDYIVQVKEVNKNNGLIMHGLTILKKGEKVCPTIYLENFFDRYDNGTTLAQIVDELVGLFGESEGMKPGNLDFFTEYEKVKSKLTIKLINKEYNKKLLEAVPHRIFHDLAIVCMVEVDMKEGSTGSVLIHNNHICMWGVAAEQLINDSLMINFEKQNIQIIEMEKLIKDIYERMCEEGTNRDEELENYMESPTGMYVVSNEKQIFGAASIVYPQVRARIAEIIGGDYIILPSSVHELIVMPSDVGGRINELNDMINEVNSTMVRREEVLADHAYLYVKKSDSIIMLSEESIKKYCSLAVQ